MTDQLSANVNKKMVFVVTFFGFFCLLIFQFFRLQILNRESYFQKSEQNRIREIVVKPARGLMFDRDEILVVDNRPSFSVSIVPYEVKSSQTVLPFLQRHFNLDEQFIKSRIKRSGYGFTPVKLISQIDLKDLSILEENKLDLPGVIHQIEPKRFYPSGIKAPQIVGYINEISERQVESLADEGYESGDFIGQQGLEFKYEKYLRGKKGYTYVQVDALGRAIEHQSLISRNVAPLRGLNLQLSLSVRIQKLLEELLDGKKGAAVVMDPRNGEVLALVSKPDYDPHFFTQMVSPDDWSEFINHPDDLLLNRAVAGEYPAGSTFKLVAAIAGLNDKVITPAWTRQCGGAFWLGRSFACFRGTVHGSLSLLGAIERSCNVYFYQLMYNRIGLPRWSRYAHMLHFGMKTGIDLPGERGGFIPTEKLLDELYGKNKWSVGLLLNFVIGQGELKVTPLQMACLMMIIGNEGTFYQPHLVRAVEDITTGEWNELEFPSEKLSAIDSSVFSVVKEGMYRVVNGNSGTGRAARVPWAFACGKTGTAQNPHGKDHGWFVGFAPRDNPSLAWAIIVESGGTGGSSAAPIARELLKEVFGEQPPEDFQTIARLMESKRENEVGD